MSSDLPLINSLQNPKVKQAVKLRDRRQREKSGLFLIEGYRELERASRGGQPIEQLFISPPLFLGENEWALIEAIASTGAKLYCCGEEVFRKISYRDRPDGLLGVAPKRPLSLADLENTLLESSLRGSIGSPAPLFVVAEAIEKPGNLGTILRSSDAVAVDALLVCDRCTDIYNPNVVRASVGTLFTVPVVESGGEETLRWLKGRGVKILAATPSAEALYSDVEMRGPLAIAVGTEQLGLSPLWMEEADLQVRIPMLGVADSLNVAMATTLLLYEANRQRSRA